MSWRAAVPKSTASGLDFDFYTAQWRKVANETRDELLEKKKTAAELLQLEATLEDLPKHLTKEAMVPFGKVAFFPGELVHTNEITVLLGDNQYAEMPACRAQRIAARRRQGVEKEVTVLERALHNLALRCDISQDIAKDEEMARLFGDEMVFDKEPDLKQDLGQQETEEDGSANDDDDEDEEDADEEDADEEDADDLKPQSMDSFLRGLLSVQQQRETSSYEDNTMQRTSDEKQESKRNKQQQQQPDAALGLHDSDTVPNQGQQADKQSKAAPDHRRTLRIRFRHSEAPSRDTTTAAETTTATTASAATPRTPADIQGQERPKVTFADAVELKTFDMREEPSRVSAQPQEQTFLAAPHEPPTPPPHPSMRAPHRHQHQHQHQQPPRRNVIPVGSVLERRQHPSTSRVASVASAPNMPGSSSPPPAFPMAPQTITASSSSPPSTQARANNNILPSRPKPSLFLQRMQQRQP